MKQKFFWYGDAVEVQTGGLTFKVTTTGINLYSATLLIDGAVVYNEEVRNDYGLINAAHTASVELYRAIADCFGSVDSYYIYVNHIISIIAGKLNKSPEQLSQLKA